MASGKTLFDVYKHPSQAKINAWERIEHEIQERNGFSVVVYGNSYTFSVYYNYIDFAERWHMVKITDVRSYDKIVYRRCNIKAQYNTSNFTTWVILDIFDDKIVSGYLFKGKLEAVRTTRVHYSNSERDYIVRNNQKLYLDMFMRTDV